MRSIYSQLAANLWNSRPKSRKILFSWGPCAPFNAIQNVSESFGQVEQAKQEADKEQQLEARLFVEIWE